MQNFSLVMYKLAQVRHPWALSTWNSVALATGLLTFLAITRRKSLHRKNLPSGPTSIPFSGNVFDIKVDAPWMSYTKMQETYGPCAQFLSLCHQFLDREQVISCIPNAHILNMETIVLNSEEVAIELLENRIYSGRP